MLVIWIDIWDSQKGSKGKTLINRSFNFGCHTATVRVTAMHPGVAQCRNCWRWGHPTHFLFFIFYIINLLHGARSQSVADYLLQVVYSFGLRRLKPPS